MDLYAKMDNLEDSDIQIGKWNGTDVESKSNKDQTVPLFLEGQKTEERNYLIDLDFEQE